MERQPASFRVTVRRDGTVRIVDRGPWLATGGPLHTLLDSRGRAGVGIADLTVVRDEEEVTVEVIDADASFWEFVRHRGAIPASCVLCGSDLPQ